MGVARILVRVTTGGLGEGCYIGVWGSPVSSPVGSGIGLSRQPTYFLLSKGKSGHILSRIYNWTKHGNRPIDNAATAHFTLHHRRRLVINIGGQKFGSQILGGQKFWGNSLLFSPKFLTTFF